MFEYLPEKKRNRIIHKLKELGLCEIDVETWLFYRKYGFLQEEVAKIFQISQSEVSRRICKVEKLFKYPYTEKFKKIPKISQMLILQEVNEEDCLEKW